MRLPVLFHHNRHGSADDALERARDFSVLRAPARARLTVPVMHLDVGTRLAAHIAPVFFQVSV